MPNKKIIAGNWKMNLLPEQASSLAAKIADRAKKLQKSSVLVFPQALLAPGVLNQLRSSEAETGCQNVSYHSDGAYTGENSAGLMHSMGFKWALVGHSERRSLFGETDEVCAKKLLKSAEAGLGVIYCIGENDEQRTAGGYLDLIARQLEVATAAFKPSASNCMHIAYEPVWAIGTGKNATVEQAVEVHTIIRSCLNKAYGESIASGISILYGGSAKGSNAKELLSGANIDGLLIGGASLKDEFIEIINISENL